MSAAYAAAAGNRQMSFDGAVPCRTVRCLVVGTLLILSPVLLAQSGGNYDLRWSTLTSGGGMMSGASGYSLNGAISPPDANAAGSMNGAGNYALRGGFWAGVHESSDAIFRNGFE